MLISPIRGWHNRTKSKTQIFHKGQPNNDGDHKTFERTLLLHWYYLHVKHCSYKQQHYQYSRVLCNSTDCVLFPIKTTCISGTSLVRWVMQMTLTLIGNWRNQMQYQSSSVEYLFRNALFFMSGISLIILTGHSSIQLQIQNIALIIDFTCYITSKKKIPTTWIYMAKRFNKNCISYFTLLYQRWYVSLIFFKAKYKVTEGIALDMNYYTVQIS